MHGRLWYILLLIGSLFWVMPAYAHRLDISSLPVDARDKLTAQFPGLPDQVSMSEMDQIVKQLYLTGQYDSVEILKNQETFSLKVSQTRRIGEIQIIGAKLFSTEEIERWLNVKEGDKFDLNQLTESADRVTQAYEDQGYVGTEISIAYPSLKPNTVSLEVTIVEKETTKISAIEITSPNSTLAKELSNKLKRFAKRPYTEKTLAEITLAARSFFSSENYYRSELEGPIIQLDESKSTTKLIYTVNRADRFEFRFTGNSSLSNSRLMNQMGLDNYFTTTPNVASDLATRIRTYYLESGFARVNVIGTEEASNKAFERIVALNIEEGPRVRIEKIEVTGRFTKEPDFYGDFIRNHSTPIVSDGYYNREGLETGYKNLVIELQNEGHLKAKVVSARTVYNDKKDRLTLIVNIDEGPLTLIQDIVFEGNEAYSNSKLMDVMNLKSGAPLHLLELEKSIQSLKSFYLEQGFLEVSLRNEKEDLVTYNDSNTEATLLFRIYEGPKIRVHDIKVEGNTLTKTYVILKEVEFERGDILTPSQIAESISRLQRLGHFTSIDIRTLEENTKIADRTVLIRVSEREPGLFTFGSGITNEGQLTLRGYTSLAYRNIGGTGRGLSSRAELNYNVREIQYPESQISVGYLEPYLFDSRVKGRVNVARTQLATTFKDPIKISETNQITFSLEQDVTSHIVAVWDVWGLAGVRDFAAREKNKSLIDDKSQQIGTTGPYVDFDFRDHPFFPTRGTFSRIAAEYSTPDIGSSKGIQYLKSTASFTHYLSWQWPGWVWANSVRGGQIQNLSNKDDGGVPYDKKGFFLGTQSTIRGFDGTSERFPDNSDLGLDSTETYKLKTRADFYLIKTELRFPIHDIFSGAVYYDGGQIQIKDPNFKLGYRDSIGAALRVNLVVPVNLEIATKLRADKARREDWYRFHFSIGTF